MQTAAELNFGNQYKTNPLFSIAIHHHQLGFNMQPSGKKPVGRYFFVSYGLSNIQIFPKTSAFREFYMHLHSYR